MYTFKTGATYTGQWIGGFRDGFGVQVWPDGARYEGKEIRLGISNTFILRLMEG